MGAESCCLQTVLTETCYCSGRGAGLQKFWMRSKEMVVPVFMAVSQILYLAGARGMPGLCLGYIYE